MHTRLFHHSALLGQIAEQNRQAAITGIGIFQRMNHGFIRNAASLHCFTQRFPADGHGVQMKGSGNSGNFMNDGTHPACTQNILHVEAGGRSHLADVGGSSGNIVDALEVIFHAGFPGNGQRMEHGIGTAAHGHINCESIVDGVTGYDVSRQGAVRLRHLHGAAGSLLPELLSFL